MSEVWGRLRGPLAATALVAALLVPRTAMAATTLDCKGVVTFADAMTRAVRMSLDLERRTVFMPSCGKYAELHGFCRGDILRADDHHFQFGGVGSFENARLTVKLQRDDAAAYFGYDPPWLKVYFLGRCEPAGRRWSMRHR